MYFASNLKVSLLAVLVIFEVAKCSSQTSNDASASYSTVSAMEGCRRQYQVEKLPTLEGMVGGGFDDLRNEPMAAVLDTTFLQCKTSPDRMYLISDQVEVTPVKRSQLDRTANFYEHYQDYF
uniref:Uncharacterized protein n=1 Tax=Plectus sambesii TaxID=2011161 RepID=A0A914XJ03_9BILA